MNSSREYIPRIGLRNVYSTDVDSAGLATNEISHYGYVPSLPVMLVFTTLFPLSTSPCSSPGAHPSKLTYISCHTPRTVYPRRASATCCTPPSLQGYSKTLDGPLVCTSNIVTSSGRILSSRSPSCFWNLMSHPSFAELSTVRPYRLLRHPGGGHQKSRDMPQPFNAKALWVPFERTIEPVLEPDHGRDCVRRR